MLLFFKQALPADQSGVALALAGYTAEVTHQAPKSTAYHHLDVLLTAAVTAGTVTVTVLKNGVASSSVVLDTGAHRTHAPLTLGVEAGDRITVTVTTTATFTPAASEDLLALVR